MSHPNSRPWTPTEDSQLRTWHGQLRNREIARRLNRTMGSIECRAKFLNLTKPHQRVSRERSERLPCDPTREQIQAAVNAIRAGLGLAAITWPETRAAEEQMELWEGVA